MVVVVLAALFTIQAIQPPTKAVDKVAFFAAVRAGDLAKVKAMLDAGVDVNTKNDYGATALVYAAEKGHVNILKLLIERKADVEAKDNFYNATAFTWAMMKDHEEAMALLIKAGAGGELAVLNLGISRNKPSLVKAALETGRLKQGTLSLTLARVPADKVEIVKLLKHAGAQGEPAKVAKITNKSEVSAKPSAKTEELSPKPAGPAPEPTERVKSPKAWSVFRGENGAGVADGQFPPTNWDATTGKNLLWKSPIPGLGLSCPIVWENQLFVTTAVNTAEPKPSLRTGQYGDVDSVKEDGSHEWKVYCLDTESGKMLWERTACTGVPKVKRHMKSSHANPTPATDGKHVVASFGSEGLYCYSMAGELLWKKGLGKLGSGWFFNPDYEWGFGSSPVLFEDKVIVQCDVGPKESFIAAYYLADGRIAWQTPRDEIPSWSTPTVVRPQHSPPELVTVATRFARGYDPYTGKELWRLGKFSEIAIPSPFYANGLIYLTTGYRPVQPIYAVKPGAKGDITLEKGKESSDRIAWSKQRGGPYLPTPLVYGNFLYVCSNSGVLSCYEATTGKSVYQQRLGGKHGYTASVVAADGRIYCTDEEGNVRVVQAGKEFKLIAVNKLGEDCLSHPAISNGKIFFRCREHVLAFGLKAARVAGRD